MDAARACSISWQQGGPGEWQREHCTSWRGWDILNFIHNNKLVRGADLVSASLAKYSHIEISSGLP